MRKVMGVVLASALLAAGSARAAEVAPGFGAGVRLSYGLPAGAASGVTGSDMSKLFSGSLPIQLDLGYRFSPNLSAAVFGQYAFAFVASDLCPSGVSCSGSVIRTGVEGFYHLMPGNNVDPWLGIGIGYEWGKVTAEQSGVSADVKFHGFEFFNAQVGADFALAPQFAVGPFVQVTFAQYSTVETLGQSGDITNKALHEWIQLGVRGTFNL